MALPSSGAISLSQVNVELGRSASAQISMGESAVRTLFGVASGQISMSNGYGKSNSYAPINTSAPTISGTTQVGSTLSVSVGSWNAQPAVSSYSYQWQRGTSNISGATGSSYTLTSSDFGNTIRCVVTATNSAGSTSATTASTGAITEPVGQSIYTSPGSYTWYAPAGVNSISVVCVGGGQGANIGTTGGRGGGLGYRNGIPGGTSYSLVVGAGGASANAYGGKSWFVSEYTFVGYATFGEGGGGVSNAGFFPSGGAGGSSGAYGGGGAGGYSGTGGQGGPFGSNGTSGAGGAGGGGGTVYSGGWFTGGGGGVGLFGEGGSGAGGVSGSRGGGGGSGGGSGGDTGAAGAYGGGGGGGENIYGFTSLQAGASGAVRVMWPGTSRLFPSTNTGNY